MARDEVKSRAYESCRSCDIRTSCFTSLTITLGRFRYCACAARCAIRHIIFPTRWPDGASGDVAERMPGLEIDLYVNVNYLTGAGGPASDGSKSAQDRPRQLEEETARDRTGRPLHART